MFLKAASIFSVILPVFFSLKAQSAHLVGAGTFVPYFGKAQVSDSGATRFFDLNPYFFYGQQFHISGPHYFMPEIGLAFYTDNPEGSKRRTIFLHYDFSYVLAQSFILRYGISTYWDTISGEGGTVTLKNGENYQEFDAPSGTHTSYYSTLDIGGEYFVRQNRSLRLDFNLMNARDWDNRAWNYLLTYNWYL